MGWLAWESDPSAEDGGDATRAWGAASGLQPGGNYTVRAENIKCSLQPHRLTLICHLIGPFSPPLSAQLYAAINQGGRPGLAAAVTGILTPSTTAPTFVDIGANVTVSEGAGTFRLELDATLDLPASVSYLLTRNYSCIKGQPPAQTVLSGAPLPDAVCSCEDPSYCASVASGTFNASAQGGAASVVGELSPLPFEALRTGEDAALKCFQGGLGQATDTYNVSGVGSHADADGVSSIATCSTAAGLQS